MEFTKFGKKVFFAVLFVMFLIALCTYDADAAFGPHQEENGGGYQNKEQNGPPTHETQPTSTPVPQPTNTPVPQTDTPQPTNTPVPPTDTPMPTIPTAEEQNLFFPIVE